jgi:hypothetical protein
MSIGIDSDLEHDLFFWRYTEQICKEIVAFGPTSFTSPVRANVAKSARTWRAG